RGSGLIVCLELAGCCTRDGTFFTSCMAIRSYLSTPLLHWDARFATRYWRSGVSPARPRCMTPSAEDLSRRLARTDLRNAAARVRLLDHLIEENNIRFLEVSIVRFRYHSLDSHHDEIFDGRKMFHN